MSSPYLILKWTSILLCLQNYIKIFNLPSTRLNILHIFILFIILSISIDYGIYISSYKTDKNTNKAIFYSILTTFAGFGVLIFSSINALFSIGISATVGVLSILFLLIFLKKEKSASNNL